VPIARQIWVGVALAISGLFLFTNDPSATGGVTVQGDLLCVLAAVFYATYDLRYAKLLGSWEHIGYTLAEVCLWCKQVNRSSSRFLQPEAMSRCVSGCFTGAKCWVTHLRFSSEIRYTCTSASYVT
jgi:hypothetical protein